MLFLFYFFCVPFVDSFESIKLTNEFVFPASIPIEKKKKTEKGEKQQKETKAETDFRCVCHTQKAFCAVLALYKDQNQTRCTKRIIHAWIKNKQNGNINVYPKHRIVFRRDLHEESERQSAAANTNTNKNKIISTFFAMALLFLVFSVCHWEN